MAFRFFILSFVIVLKCVSISKGEHNYRSENQELLGYEASLNSEKSYIDILKKTSDDTGSNIWISDCFIKRREPRLSLIRNELLFDKNCERDYISLEEQGKEICKYPQRFCHVDVPLAYGLTKEFTLSVLFKANCSARRTTRLISWNNFNTDILCLPDSIRMEICHDRKQSQYELPSTEQYVSIILESITNSSESEINVAVDGEIIRPKAMTSGSICGSGDGTALLVGYKENSVNEIGVGGVMGTIRAIDVFQGTLHDRHMEYQYMKLLARGALYPECLCPLNQYSPSLPETCKNGVSRFTGALPGEKRFIPIRSISDGIMNSSMGYGFWPAIQGGANTIRITLDKASEISRFEILAAKGTVWVYSDKCDCSQWHNVFCGIHTSNPYEASSCSASTTFKSSELVTVTWKNVPGEKYKSLVWSHPVDRQPLITKAFLVVFSDREPIGSFPLPIKSATPVFEIMIYGRTLDEIGPEGGYFCPRGDKSRVIKECSRCTCTSRDHILQGALCTPYISSLYPKYGPLSGGTIITMTGGLLAPDRKNLSTKVELGEFELCRDSIVRNTTHVICTTRPGKRSLLGIEQRVQVNILIGGAFYRLPTKRHHVYKYLPDPYITNVLPYKAFLGGTRVTVTGSNFASMALPSSKGYMHLILIGHTEDLLCHILNDVTMVCDIPKRRDDTAVKTYIGFTFDGQLKYLNLSAVDPKFGAFMIYPDPEFSKQSLPYLGKVLELKGQNLHSGCVKDDYKVTIGDEECKVFEVDSTTLYCYPHAKSRKPTNSKLLIVVKVHHFVFVVGTVQYTNLEEDITSLGPIVGGASVAGICLLCLLVALVLVLRRMRRMHRRWEDTEIIDLHQKISLEELPMVQAPSLSDLINTDFKRTIVDFLIERRQVHIENEIGTGNFGKVHRGILMKDSRQVEVAIKTLKDHRTANAHCIREFLDEATIMRNLHHPNVLPLLGVVLEEQSCFVLLPFMENGDLRSFVSSVEFNLKKFTALILDVTDGMAYLSDRKFIHRDLAARNCMVDASEKVLIGDFGLARDIYAKDYYQLADKKRPLPIKWMAPECIDKGIFSNKSDVWAFAVLMWELFTQGAKPYALVRNYDMGNYLKDGNRLGQPENCPDEMYGLMRKCWRTDPVERPTFYNIQVDLRWIEKTSIIESQHPLTEAKLDIGMSHQEGSAIATVISIDEKGPFQNFGLNSISSDEIENGQVLASAAKQQQICLDTTSETMNRLPAMAPKAMPRLHTKHQARQRVGESECPEEMCATRSHHQETESQHVVYSDDYVPPRKCCYSNEVHT